MLLSQTNIHTVHCTVLQSDSDTQVRNVQNAAVLFVSSPQNIYIINA